MAHRTSPWAAGKVTHTAYGSVGSYPKDATELDATPACVHALQGELLGKRPRNRLRHVGPAPSFVRGRPP